jgi:hypothetical protein
MQICKPSQFFPAKSGNRSQLDFSNGGVMAVTASYPCFVKDRRAQPDHNV